MRRAVVVSVAVLAPAGGRGEEEDLPEPTGGEYPSEVIPGEEGRVN